MGRVEVFDRRSNQWGTICALDIFHRRSFAHIICKSLGYSSHRNYGSTSSSSNISLSSNDPIVNGTIFCTHISRAIFAQHNLYQCSQFELQLIKAPSRCASDQELMVDCVRKFLCLDQVKALKFYRHRMLKYLTTYNYM